MILSSIQIMGMVLQNHSYKLSFSKYDEHVFLFHLTRVYCSIKGLPSLNAFNHLLHCFFGTDMSVVYFIAYGSVCIIMSSCCFQIILQFIVCKFHLHISEPVVLKGMFKVQAMALYFFNGMLFNFVLAKQSFIFIMIATCCVKSSHSISPTVCR